jgi:peptide/nickel transport system permease protein
MAEPAVIHATQEGPDGPAPTQSRQLLEGPAGTPMSYWRLVWWRLRRDKVTLTAAAVILCIVLSAVLAPYVAPHNPVQGSIRKRLAPIGTPSHLLGTDEQGRDMLSRLLFGGRLSLTAGIVPVCVALLAGSTLGILAGFMGRWVNMLIMRIMDIFYAFPSVLLAIAISGALGAGMVNTIIALSIVFTPPITRVAESVTTQVRGWDFMEAARASGAGPLAIMCHHMIANVLGPIFVYASTLVSVSVILAAGLSFLGLGASPPNPEWGLMLNTLRQSIYVNTWVPVLPGVMIFLTSMAFNLLSDGLRDAMDVRL